MIVLQGIIPNTSAGSRFQYGTALFTKNFSRYLFLPYIPSFPFVIYPAPIVWPYLSVNNRLLRALPRVFYEEGNMGDNFQRDAKVSQFARFLWGWNVFKRFRKYCCLWSNEKVYRRVRQAAHEFVVIRMRFECWISKSTKHSLRI